MLAIDTAAPSIPAATCDIKTQTIILNLRCQAQLSQVLRGGADQLPRYLIIIAVTVSLVLFLGGSFLQVFPSTHYINCPSVKFNEIKSKSLSAEVSKQSVNKKRFKVLIDISMSFIRNRTSNTEIGRVLFQCYKSYFR